MPRWLAICSAASIAACSPPSPPPPPPADKLPAQESAATCGVTTDFAQSKFYFADLEEGRSCEVFLEQDECVLAIYDDCTWVEERRQQFGVRQWLGRIDRKADSQDYEVRLSPVHERTPSMQPPRNCRGQAIDPRGAQARVYLECESLGYADFFLEKKDTSATAWGTRDAMEQIDVRETPNATSIAMQDMELVDVAGRRELWVPFNWSSDLGGVYVWRIGSPVRTATRVVTIANATRIAFNPERDLVLVAQGDEKATTERKLHLIDAATRAERRTIDLDGPVDRVASLPGGDRWAVFRLDPDARGKVIELYGAEDLMRVGRVANVPGLLAGGMTAVSGGGTVVLVAATQSDEGSQLFGYDRELNEIWNEELDDTEVGELIDLPGKNRVGFVVELGNRWHELDPQTGTIEAPIPVPFHDGLAAASYDPAGDRVFLMNLFGSLSVVDRAAGRVLQSNAYEQGAQSDVIWDAGSGRLYVLRPRFGDIATVRPN